VRTLSLLQLAVTTAITLARGIPLIIVKPNLLG
jgi:hypothetical protein